jgi:hypothetical protein
MRIWRATIAGTAGAVLAILGLAVPAQGAQPQSTAEAASNPAPSCVNLDQWVSSGTRHASVFNNCSYTVRVRLIWRWAEDGRCKTLTRATGYNESRGDQAHITELRNC